MDAALIFSGCSASSPTTWLPPAARRGERATRTIRDCDDLATLRASDVLYELDHPSCRFALRCPVRRNAGNVGSDGVTEQEFSQERRSMGVRVSRAEYGRYA